MTNSIATQMKSVIYLETAFFGEPAIARVNMLHPAAGDATFIISAEREALGPSGSGYNAEAMDKLAGRLERIRARGLAYNIHGVAGAYQGRPEESLAITGPNSMALLNAILETGIEYQQDSILMVTADGRGTLGFMDGRDPMPIGRMTAVDPAELEGLEAYSVIKSTGEAFTFV